ncbi:pro-sigmaK processing inhibitor BofA family protein [Sedimentibacter hydroxybenzoicus DSM 7310]|uniref:Pro-sigmaK processing inhibitor BofA family protein n=1 Tax=Sedimentibacter hydroxybenzoicus DSM 7310 TaxID=1123245 RepID=A0A974GW43_SEDHY|nr:pro-sigmaK processing inhibitor BofA family protein [Sedimentibacter hydroxybenzoicus]NYB74079.1 pro-sigmaK processing inhibitor BofA family protein [Sedimentibacter hydroxybenzoicus DSM 7310]
MGADIGIVLAYSAGIMLVFMVSWIFVKPLKFLGKMVLNSILGAVFLIIFNYFGQYFGLHIAVNEITALILGILGIPGFIAILIIKIFL